MRFIFLLDFLLLFFFNGICVFSQDTCEKDLFQLENKIAICFDLLLKSRNDAEKDLINNDIIELLEKVLNTEKSFNYPFDSLKRIGKIMSSDKRLRIYTWNIPYNNGSHRYFGYLQYVPDKSKMPIVYPLTDKSDEITEPEKQVLNTGNWYGALYYDIVYVKDQNTGYYTLLGFDFNNLTSSKKVIDILCFGDSGQPVFGKPIFRLDNKIVHRIIFEFSSQVSMNLRYNKDMDMIIFDHLSPSKPSFTGKFEFYGPDMSYDAIEFEKGVWNLKKDIDIRNQPNR